LKNDKKLEKTNILNIKFYGNWTNSFFSYLAKVNYIDQTLINITDIRLLTKNSLKFFSKNEKNSRYTLFLKKKFSIQNSQPHTKLLSLFTEFFDETDELTVDSGLAFLQNNVVTANNNSQIELNLRKKKFSDKL
jgi:hypothetical protein